MPQAAIDVNLPATMRAARYRPGHRDDSIRVDEVPRPHPASGEVLVAIAVSAVNPTDWKSRARAEGAGEHEWVIPNQDGAGTVVDVGAGVARERIGQRVWVWQAQYGRGTGTAAEYVAVPDAHAVVLPDDASFELGAGLGIPAMTAHRCLFGDGPLTPSDRVLVQGGAGAVGHAAIELARWAGAHVATTVSSPEKAELAAAAGAEEIIDYRREDAVARLTAWAPSGVSRIVEVDLANNLDTDAAVIAQGGVIAVYAQTSNGIQPSWDLMERNVSIDFMLVYTMPAAAKAAAADAINAALSAGALTALPGPRFELAQAAAAHDAVQASAMGKVLIEIGDTR